MVHRRCRDGQLWRTCVYSALSGRSVDGFIYFNVIQATLFNNAFHPSTSTTTQQALCGTESVGSCLAAEKSGRTNRCAWLYSHQLPRIALTKTPSATVPNYPFWSKLPSVRAPSTPARVPRAELSGAVVVVVVRGERWCVYVGGVVRGAVCAVCRGVVWCWRWSGRTRRAPFARLLPRSSRWRHGRTLSQPRSDHRSNHRLIRSQWTSPRRQRCCSAWRNVRMIIPTS